MTFVFIGASGACGARSDLATRLGLGGDAGLYEGPDGGRMLDASGSDTPLAHDGLSDVMSQDAVLEASRDPDAVGLEGSVADALCSSRSWATSNCPGLGCPEGTICVRQHGNGMLGALGCAPIPALCGGDGTCACMSCVCDEYVCSDTILPGELVCH